LPHIQDIHERYGDHGVVVLAISREPVSKMKPFLDQNGYTMRAGSDGQKAMWSAYGVDGIPSSRLIDAEGKLVWSGSPYESEEELEKLLGLPREPGELLGAALAAWGDKEKLKPLLLRLARKAPTPFDLKAWAGKLSLAPMPEGKSPPKLKPEAALDQYAAGNAAAAHALAAQGPERFDLAAWARERVAKLYPVKKDEIQAMLAAARFRSVLEALATRDPAGPVVQAVAKDDRFIAFCRRGFEERRKLARKALMALHWPLANRTPEDNDGFWRDISVSGMATSEDQRRVVGILIAGTMVSTESAPAFIDGQLTEHLLMKALAAGDKVAPARLGKDVEKERESILKELKAKYGWAQVDR
jgi:hypothetical protein